MQKPGESAYMNRARLLQSLGVLFFLLSVSACSQIDDSGRVSRVENGLLPATVVASQVGVKTDINQRMSDYAVPGLSVAVIDDGRVVWAKGYGLIHTGSDKPVTSDTLFQAASISKPVVAVGALRLVTDGMLNLDDSVNSQLTSWQIPENQFTNARKVTLRQLLSHSAGVTVHGFPGYSQETPLPTLTDILNGDLPANTPRIEVDIPVGSEWRYSGGGYTIVQQLMIDVSDKPFPELLAEFVLIPLGMTDSTFEQPLPISQIERAALGHQPGLGPVSGGFHVYPEMAAAGLWTTATDLARFATGIQNAIGGKPFAIDGPMVTEMLTIQKGNYGLGLELAGTGQSFVFSHSGINEGFDSMLIAYSRLGKGAVVMTNSNMSRGLIDEIIGSIAAEYEWPGYPAGIQRQIQQFTETQLDKYPGTYDLGDDFIISVRREGDRLFLSIPNHGVTEIYLSKSGDRMFVTGFPLPEFQFISEDTESTIHLEFLPLSKS